MVSYIAIENDEGNIQLSDLSNYRGEPMLHFKGITGGFWDNSDYLKRMFKKLEKDGKHNQLKDFCLDNNLNFKEVVRDLLEIYKESKKLKFWKKK